MSNSESSPFNLFSEVDKYNVQILNSSSCITHIAELSTSRLCLWLFQYELLPGKSCTICPRQQLKSKHPNKLNFPPTLTSSPSAGKHLKCAKTSKNSGEERQDL